MICRLWRGLTRPEEADHYVEHLRQQTLPRLRELPGFVDVSILRRQLDRGEEFLVITRWGSLKAIEQFAGSDYSVAVVPPEAQRMMIDYDRTVRHYEVIE
jgi:heme-degrading monooxygenase HmoA